jgi:hypothetical protein
MSDAERGSLITIAYNAKTLRTLRLELEHGPLDAAAAPAFPSPGAAAAAAPRASPASEPPPGLRLAPARSPDRRVVQRPAGFCGFSRDHDHDHDHDRDRDHDHDRDHDRDRDRDRVGV